MRFGPRPVRAPYLVQQASFVGCHHFGLLEQVDVLGCAAPGRDAAAQLPAPARGALGRAAAPGPGADPRQRIDVYAIDAGRIAREVGLAGRINIVLQAIALDCHAVEGFEVVRDEDPPRSPSTRL